MLEIGNHHKLLFKSLHTINKIIAKYQRVIYGIVKLKSEWKIIFTDQNVYNNLLKFHNRLDAVYGFALRRKYCQEMRDKILNYKLLSFEN